jgi:hypothetical protein
MVFRDELLDKMTITLDEALSYALKTGRRVYGTDISIGDIIIAERGSDTVTGLLVGTSAEAAIIYKTSDDGRTLNAKFTLPMSEVVDFYLQMVDRMGASTGKLDEDGLDIVIGDIVEFTEAGGEGIVLDAVEAMPGDAEAVMVLRKGMREATPVLSEHVKVMKSLYTGIKDHDDNPILIGDKLTLKASPSKNIIVTGVEADTILVDDDGTPRKIDVIRKKLETHTVKLEERDVDKIISRLEEEDTPPEPTEPAPTPLVKKPLRRNTGHFVDGEEILIGDIITVSDDSTVVVLSGIPGGVLKVLNQSTGSIFDAASVGVKSRKFSFSLRTGLDTGLKNAKGENILIGEVSYKSALSPEPYTGIVVGDYALKLYIGSVDGDPAFYEEIKPENVLGKIGEVSPEGELDPRLATGIATASGYELMIGDYIEVVDGNKVLIISVNKGTLRCLLERKSDGTLKTPMVYTIKPSSVKNVTKRFSDYVGNRLVVGHEADDSVGNTIFAGSIVEFDDGEQGVALSATITPDDTYIVVSVFERISTDTTPGFRFESAKGLKVVGDVKSVSAKVTIDELPEIPGTTMRIGDEVMTTIAPSVTDAIVLGMIEKKLLILTTLTFDRLKISESDWDAHVALTRPFRDRIGEENVDWLKDSESNKLLVGDLVENIKTGDQAIVIINEYYYNLTGKRMVKVGKLNLLDWKRIKEGKDVEFATPTITVTPAELPEDVLAIDSIGNLIRKGDRIEAEGINDPMEVVGKSTIAGTLKVVNTRTGEETTLPPIRMTKLSKLSITPFPGPPAKTIIEANNTFSTVHKTAVKYGVTTVSIESFIVISDTILILSDIIYLDLMSSPNECMIYVQGIEDDVNLSFLHKSNLRGVVELKWKVGDAVVLEQELIDKYKWILGAIIADNINDISKIPEVINKFEKSAEAMGNLINLFREFFTVVKDKTMASELMEYYKSSGLKDILLNVVNTSNDLRKLPHIEPYALRKSRKENIEAHATAAMTLSAVKLSDLSPLDDLSYDIEKLAPSKTKMILAAEAENIKKSVKSELGFSDVESGLLARIIAKKPSMTSKDVDELLSRISKTTKAVSLRGLEKIYTTDFKRIVSSLSKVIAKLLQSDSPLKRII